MRPGLVDLAAARPPPSAPRPRRGPPPGPPPARRRRPRRPTPPRPGDQAARSAWLRPTSRRSSATGSGWLSTRTSQITSLHGIPRRLAGARPAPARPPGRASRRPRPVPPRAPSRAGRPACPPRPERLEHRRPHLRRSPSCSPGRTTPVRWTCPASATQPRPCGRRPCPSPRRRPPGGTRPCGRAAWPRAAPRRRSTPVRSASRHSGPYAGSVNDCVATAPTPASTQSVPDPGGERRRLDGGAELAGAHVARDDRVGHPERTSDHAAAGSPCAPVQPGRCCEAMKSPAPTTISAAHRPNPSG